jgi:hypothetical protein
MAAFTFALDLAHETAVQSFIDRVVAHVRQPATSTRLTRRSYSSLPSIAGLYAIYEHDSLIYVGETGCLSERLRDIFQTRNHSFRRKLGKKLFASEPGFVAATSKQCFAPDIESRLTAHMETALTFLVVPMKFCRTEVEERLVAECDGLLNSRGQRGV